MGAICCKEEEKLNPFSKKLMQINTITKQHTENNQDEFSPIRDSKYSQFTDSPHYNTINNSNTVHVLDIEDEIGLELEANLRIFKRDIEGFSQLNFNNSLYLCGANNEDSGSYLVRFDPNKNGRETHFLINSINHHYYPTMLGYRSDFIIVIGGSLSKCVEIYNIKTNKWKNLPELPEERFKCSAIHDEITDYVYIFGGYNSEILKNCQTLLRMNMKSTLIWETLIVKSNQNLLSRNSSAIIKFDKINSIYILGGKNNEDINTDFIVEYEINSRNSNLLRKKLIQPSHFLQSTGSDLNKSDFFLFDYLGSLHKICKNEFSVTFIEFKRIFENYD